MSVIIIKKYYCQFPNCDYKTNEKSQIVSHHIKPVELNGSDAAYNRMNVCPTHHTHIYIPAARHGIHTINGEISIIVLGWLQSTGGKVLEYIDNKGENQYYLIEDQKISIKMAKK